jgi:hypothetical protein
VYVGMIDAPLLGPCPTGDGHNEHCARKERKHHQERDLDDEQRHESSPSGRVPAARPGSGVSRGRALDGSIGQDAQPWHGPLTEAAGC